MKTLPHVRPEFVTFEVWRWRPDVDRWVKVTSRPTIEEARDRVTEEASSPRYRTPPTMRITRSVLTRTEVE